MAAITRTQLRPFEAANRTQGLVQLLLTFGCFAASLALAFWLAGQASHLWVWPFLPLSVLAASIFLERVFIIQHDCGHGAFFPTLRLNRVVGRACSLFTLTPFRAWAMEHNVHHANFGNLDKAGTGEMLLLDETTFHTLPWYKRLFYRIFRNPFFLVVLLPYLIFVLRNRWTCLSHRKAIASAMATNAALLAAYGVFFWLAPLAWSLVMLAVWYMAGLIAVLFFYVQHNFEEAQYRPDTNWNYEAACAEACSFLILPRWLDWATGYISHHHLHHLSSKIPFYNLPAAQAALGALVPATRLHFHQVPRLLKLALWSPGQKRVIPFSASLAG